MFPYTYTHTFPQRYKDSTMQNVLKILNHLSQMLKELQKRIWKKVSNNNLIKRKYATFHKENTLKNSQIKNTFSTFS